MLLTENLDRIDQGSIIKGIPHPSFSNLEISVALNPTCDFHNGKANSVILAYLIPAKYVLERNEEYKQQTDALTEEARRGAEHASKKKSSTIRKFIGKIIDNAEPRRHFFLRGIEDTGLPNVFVDFQQIGSFPFDFVVEKSKVIAKVKSPWREQLATHYASYMMRIGVDRFEDGTREQIISDLVAPIQLTSA